MLPRVGCWGTSASVATARTTASIGTAAPAAKLALLGLIDPRRPIVPVGSKVGNRHFLELWRDRVGLKSEAAALSLAPPSRHHLFTFKRLRHRATGRWLTAAEMLQDPLRHVQRAWPYEVRGIEIVENDADDIRGLIRERLGGPDPEVSPEEIILSQLFEASGLVLNARPPAGFLRGHGDSLGIL